MSDSNLKVKINHLGYTASLLLGTNLTWSYLASDQAERQAL